MKFTIRVALPAAALSLAAIAPALAQPVSPEQRIQRLERQLQQLQRRVFPQGQPADTAGLPYEPAATQAAVSNLDNRLVTLERQVAEVLRYSEENAHRLRQLDTQIQEMRADQDRRIRQLEERLAAAEATPREPIESAAVPSRPSPPVSRPAETATGSSAPASPDSDPAEAAYDEGYQLWKAGKYDQAVASLRAFSRKYPSHRRTSWANNLAGRALLDKGDARAAAEALLANYRANPRGERAQDSLFYLGQALMELDQPAQACKAYAELEAVYGDSVRPALKDMLPEAKSKARC